MDDEEIVRSILTRHLTRSGFSVIEATSGVGAARVVIADKAREIRSAFVDYELPDLNGLTLARHFRADRPDIRFVVMSGADLSREIDPAEGIAFLSKPFTWQDAVAILAPAEQ